MSHSQMLYAALRQGLYIGLMGTWDVTIGINTSTDIMSREKATRAYQAFMLPCSPSITAPSITDSFGK